MEENIPQNIQDSLSKKYACYVLITCDEPSANGEMNVQMSYEGDASLASYLIEGAQSIMEGQNE